MKLRKYKVEIEICAPEHAEVEDLHEYINSLVRDSDVASLNDVYAIGAVEITDEGGITVEEWNGDPIDEVNLDSEEVEEL